ncbi:MAG: hypothetical protein U0S36_02530 [Candidatus Nanopelagicales bacterium]
MSLFIAVALSPATASAVPAATGTVSAQAPALTGIAKAWKGARWVNKRTVNTATRPVPIAQELITPVLKGADRANRRAISKWVTSRVSHQRTLVARWRSSLNSTGDCDANFDPTAFLYASNTHGIHARRYASAALVFTTNPGCGGVDDNQTSTGAWDLKSHRQLSIGDLAKHPFYDGNRRSLQLELWREVTYGDLSTCVVDPEIGFTPERAAVKRFTLSKAGIVLHLNRYEGGLVGACASPAVVIPWESIVLTKRGTSIARYYGHRGAKDVPLVGE